MGGLGSCEERLARRDLPGDRLTCNTNNPHPLRRQVLYQGVLHVRTRDAQVRAIRRGARVDPFHGERGVGGGQRVVTNESLQHSFLTQRHKNVFSVASIRPPRRRSDRLLFREVRAEARLQPRHRKPNKDQLKGYIDRGEGEGEGKEGVKSISTRKQNKID